MTALDLAAVCRRHQLTVDIDDDTGAWCGYAHVTDEDGAVVRGAESEQEVVCVLLKARYRITAGWYRHTNGQQRWTTQCDALFDINEYPTELAAVVALADRLAAREGGR